MRVIDAKLGEVRAVAVSPDGRFVAAAGADGFGAFAWATGAPVPLVRSREWSEQLAFGPAGGWVARVARHGLRLEEVTRPVLLPPSANGPYSGGVAVTPDGKALVATSVRAFKSRLDRWALPALKPLSGFDVGSPFRRLAFSPDGEFLGGVWGEGFELRFAATGGLDHRRAAPRYLGFPGPGFVTFDRDSTTCAFGWENELHTLDISSGTSKPGPTVAAHFRDAAFSPGADLFATVGDDGRLKLWNPAAWAVTCEYDWGCGPLTCLAFTADGSAGVCGTADGRLVQFDVDV